MPLYQHRYQGHLAAGDIFVFSWWSQTSIPIDTSHGNAVTWATNFFAGPGGTNGYASYLGAEVGIDRITTGEIDVNTGKQQTLRETVSTLTGGVTGGNIPQEVALVVSLRTALANRRGRGRFYLPQPNANTLATDGTVLAAAQQGIVNALTFAWTTSNNAGETPVVYGRPAPTATPPRAALVTNVSSFNVGDLFDVQTRRQNSLTETRITAPMP